MRITIDVGTRADGSIESIIAEANGDELHRELLVLNDIGVCQMLVKNGWTPPEHSLHNMRRSVGLRTNSGRAICHTCDKVPDAMVVCCQACLEKSRGIMRFTKDDMVFARPAGLALAKLFGRRREAADEGITVVTHEWRGKIYVTEIKEKA